MKYIVGAGIGGLFGLSVPFMMAVRDIPANDIDSRLEDFQPVEDNPPVPIDNALILPDNTCEFISYDSEDIKERAKECLRVELPAIPAI
jgi:hypothetical protein